MYLLWLPPDGSGESMSQARRSICSSAKWRAIPTVGIFGNAVASPARISTMLSPVSVPDLLIPWGMQLPLLPPRSRSSVFLFQSTPILHLENLKEKYLRCLHPGARTLLEPFVFVFTKTAW